MGIHTRIANAASRRLETMFPGYFGGSVKQNFYKDFGWPEQLAFQQFYGMYQRNGLATAAVERTIGKTWESHPWLLEVQPEDHGDETTLEQDIRRRFGLLRFWQALMEADRRSLVGEYAGVILRFADGLTMDRPVANVSGLEGLVEVIPAWQGQLVVGEWDQDETSPTYGKPLSFMFNETAVGDAKTNRQFRIHPDRVVIWSRDGSTFGQSMLQPGYNDLLDMQKISGSGGEGFWKNAKSAPVLEVDKEARMQDMAEALGIPVEQIVDKLDGVVTDWQTGLDSLLMLQGITAKTLNVTLPSPEHFHRIPLQSFAASVSMPMKILVGSQTGERASTEDAEEWAQTNMSRRMNIVIPNIMAVIDRLERFGVLPDRDWSLDWADLTEASASEKIDRAAKMADINQKAGTRGELAFTADEIRGVAGYEPLEAPIGENDPDDAASALGDTPEETEE
ncbi:anti-CBASS protein Acb1 family protein [Falsirhodobacter sp. 1013]|uniref:anti-CBASS protein Acb1 family protein n=1 Tax=Falsirhodobacter sp. 1013 TaxID=3417566 RepID=UPI003EB72E94